MKMFFAAMTLSSISVLGMQPVQRPSSARPTEPPQHISAMQPGAMQPGAMQPGAMKEAFGQLWTEIRRMLHREVGEDSYTQIEKDKLLWDLQRSVENRDHKGFAQYLRKLPEDYAHGELPSEQIPFQIRTRFVTRVVRYISGVATELSKENIDHLFYENPREYLTLAREYLLENNPLEFKSWWPGLSARVRQDPVNDPSNYVSRQRRSEEYTSYGIHKSVEDRFLKTDYAPQEHKFLKKLKLDPYDPEMRKLGRTLYRQELHNKSRRGVRNPADLYTHMRTRKERDAERKRERVRKAGYRDGH